ncbi:MAG: efflux RND transporter periplasmic adaptor subunit [Desulfovibrionaceae bacterium]|nr:efflux RND transporter periplasmic adaptor subunit [Desulfovibrionaceae bacterium]
MLKLFLKLFLPLTLILLLSCKENSPQKVETINEVQVLKVVPEKISLSVELSGRVNAFKTAEVRPQVGGILQKQLFTEGSLVKAGQSLYKIDPSTYAAEVRSAEAALSKAKAGLHQAKLRRDRRLGLLGSHAVSQQAVEDAEAEYLQAKADVEVCEASLLTAQIRLRYTDVLAPITGRIGKSQITQGSLVTANQEQPLAIIHQLDPVYVDMTRQSADLFKLTQLLESGRLKPRHPHETEVSLIVGENYHYPLKGKLQFADISVDESTGMVLLRAIFPNPKLILLTGLYVRALVEEGIAEGAICLPEKAVQRNARGQASVFVVDSKNLAQIRYIETAQRVGKKIVIKKGLEPGELVVIEGFRRLKAGDKLKFPKP